MLRLRDPSTPMVGWQVNREVVGLTMTRRGACILEMGVIACLGVTTINLLAVLVTGGYRLNLGLIRVAAVHLQGPELLFLLAAMATDWLRTKGRGIPAAMRWRSP